ncbi:MAG: hypothetical protein HZC51_07850 [Nitrospirae bacterium]|nr:hypothetical protein [Nitrospirota bacterium]
MITTVTIIIMLGMCLFVFLSWRYDALSYIYDAKLRDYGIDFVLLSYLKVYTLKFSNIEHVKDVGGGYLCLNVFNFKNRFFHTTFLIRKKKGWIIRQLLITPSDSNAFVTLLSSKGIKFL